MPVCYCAISFYRETPRDDNIDLFSLRLSFAREHTKYVRFIRLTFLVYTHTHTCIFSTGPDKLFSRHLLLALETKRTRKTPFNEMRCVTGCVLPAGTFMRSL